MTTPEEDRLTDMIYSLLLGKALGFLLFASSNNDGGGSLVDLAHATIGATSWIPVTIAGWIG